MMKSFDAIAFDIDGTLYPAWKLNTRLIPFCLYHAKTMLAFKKVRQEFHRTPQKQDIFHVQAEKMASYIYKSFSTADEATRLALTQKTRDWVDTMLYHGWLKTYKKVRIYDGVKDIFVRCKKEGIPIGVLSDFLPVDKIKNWGLGDYVSVTMGSEESGALKPSKLPFLMLAEKLNVAPDRLLYVGNDYEYDCVGGKNAGLKTALITKSTDDFPMADIKFKNYQELYNIIFEN